MKNSIILSIITCMAINAHADWADDVIAADIQAASVYRSPGGATYIDGGGIRYRPYQGSEPGPYVGARSLKIAGGCNGIDMDFGGLQFNGAALIEKLKKILASSEGYAFDIALKTYCPQCADVLEFLDATGQAGNAMDLDSCGIASSMVDSIAQGASNYAAKNGLSAPNSTYGQSNFKTQIDKYTQSLKDFKDQGGLNSIIQSALRNSPIQGGESFIHNAYPNIKQRIGGIPFGFATDRQAEAFLASIFGDVYVYTGKEESEGIQLVRLEPESGTLFEAIQKMRDINGGYQVNLLGFPNIYGNPSYNPSSYAYTRQEPDMAITCSTKLSAETIKQDIENISGFLKGKVLYGNNVVQSVSNNTDYKLYTMVRYAYTETQDNKDLIAQYIHKERVITYLRHAANAISHEYRNFLSKRNSKGIDGKVHDIDAAYTQAAKNYNKGIDEIEKVIKALNSEEKTEEATKAYFLTLVKAKENKKRTYQEGLSYLQRGTR